MRYLGTCDGNMQEGSLRADVNVSVRKLGSDKFGTRCEIKNVNSIRFMELAIETEAKRQVEILESGRKINQETRLFDIKKNVYQIASTARAPGANGASVKKKKKIY